MSLTFQLFQFSASGGALLLHCVIKGTLLLIALTALLAVARRASAALRHTLWLGGCIALLLLPLLTLRLPAWQPAVVTPALTATQPQPSSGNPSQVTPPDTGTPGFLLTLATGRSTSDSRNAPFNTAQMALAACFAVWFFGAAIAALRLALGQRAATRLLRCSQPVTHSLILGEFAACARSLELKTAPRLFTGPVPVPLTWGALRPVVLLPEAALTWPLSCRRAALLHELSHIRRSDWLTQSVASLACLVYWFHPLAWLAARRLRLESERATDDQVLLSGVKAPDYSSCLVEIVRLMGATPKDSVMKFAVPIAGTSRLETRLRSILDPRQKRGAVSAPVLVSVALLGAVGLVPLAAARERTATEPDFSTPESTLRSFTAAFDAAQFETALSCVAGNHTPGPFLLEFERRANLMQRTHFPLGPLKTVIHGQNAHVTIGGHANMQMLSWDGRVIGNAETVAGTIQFHRDAQGWKMVSKKRATRSAKRPAPSILPEIADTLATDILPASLSLAAKSDRTLPACIMNLEQLQSALSWPGPGHKLDFKNWKQTFTDRLKSQVGPNADVESLFHCPDDKGGADSYSINTGLNGVLHEKAWGRGGNIVLLYEGHNRKLDYRHNGKAVVVTVGNGTKLISPQEAKGLLWGP